VVQKINGCKNMHHTGSLETIKLVPYVQTKTIKLNTLVVIIENKWKTTGIGRTGLVIHDKDFVMYIIFSYVFTDV
jgi:hypothetical protein